MSAPRKQRWYWLLLAIPVVVWSAIIANELIDTTQWVPLEDIRAHAEQVGDSLREMADDLPRWEVDLVQLANELSWQNRAGDREIVRMDRVDWDFREITALAEVAEPGALIAWQDIHSSFPQGSRMNKQGGSTGWARWIWEFQINLPEGYDEEGRALAQAWVDYLLDNGWEFPERRITNQRGGGRYVTHAGLAYDGVEGRWIIQIWDRPVSRTRFVQEDFYAVEVRISSPETRTR